MTTQKTLLMKQEKKPPLHSSSCPIATIFDSLYPPHRGDANSLLERLRHAILHIVDRKFLVL